MLANFDVVKNGTEETGIEWNGGRATAECKVPLTYTVEYKSDLTGAAGLDTTTHYTTTEDNNQVFTIEANDPTLDNYKFKGWALNGDTSTLYMKGNKLTITGNTTLAAQWEAGTQTHTVSFVADVTGVSQMPDAIDVPDGKKVSDVLDVNTMAKPQLADHTFLRWAEEENGGAPFSFDTVPTKDITLHAVFARNEVDIRWPDVTGMAGVQNLNKNHTSVPKGSTVSFNITLQPGYQFNQGDVQVNGIPLGWTIKENTNKTTTYYFSFVANAEPTVEGQKATMKVTVNEPSIKKQVITLPSGTGYYALFTNCKNSAGQGLTKANVSSSYEFSYGDTFEIELHVTGVKKTVTLVVDGQEHIVGDKRGTFKCGDITNHQEHKVTDQPINISVRVEEQYTWRVDYVLLPNVGNYAPQYVSDGNTIAEKPMKPEIDGYTFDNEWYTDPSCKAEYKWTFGTGTDADKVTKDMILYGKLVKKTYQITYNLNVPKVNETEVGTVQGWTDGTTTTKNHGEPAKLADVTPTLEGYVFKGWATSKDGPVAYQPGEQYLIDADLTLWAVWAKKTYTVTVSSGAGYSTVPAGVNTVAHGDTFKLTIIVERQYAAEKPKVTDATGKAAAVDVSENLGGTTSAFHAAKYTYEITNVTDDHVIEINVTQNKVHQVSYFTAKEETSGDGTTTTTTKLDNTAFMIQSVEHGYYASMPATPERSGYKFDHWERYVNGVRDTTKIDAEGKVVAGTLGDNEVFTKAITEDGVEFWAVYKKIVPTITIVNKNNICQGTPHNHLNGFGLENWAHDSTNSPVYSDTNKANIVNGEFKIAYGDSVAFDLVIDKGYDYSQLSVTANGLSMGLGDSITLNDDESTTIHYVLNHVTGNTRISVANIQRKTITINYFANAGDDVAQVPGPQTGVKYYIEGATNDTISSFEPKRNGYNFLGWCEVPDGTLKFDETTGKTLEYVELGGTKYKVYQPGDTAEFEKDTNLYAIWEAADLTVDLLISDEFIDYTSSTSPKEGSTLDYAYEGETIYLTGKLGEKAQGTMTFYKKWRNATTWTLIGTTTVNGGKFGTIETTAEAYQWDHVNNKPNNKYRWDYKVEFTPTNEEGYKDCEGQDDLRVYSKAISWELNKTPSPWTLKDTKANQLTIYTAEPTTTNPGTADQMVAGRTYWLQIPNVVELDGGLALENKKNLEENGRYTEGYPKTVNVGEHYEIVWEYEDSKDHWKTYTTTSDTDWVKITEEYSGYSFRAKVTPTKVGIYDKAATYDDKGVVVKNVYWDYLITEATDKTDREDTAITLEVNTDDEPNAVVINGGTPFIDKGFAQNDTHKAQYEYQTIDLVAKVTKTDTDKTAIGMGTVAFYRYVGKDSNDKDIWEEIGTVDVQPNGENTGVAVFTYEMPGYDEGTQTNPTPVTDNVETFKAVYLENATYAKSSAEGAKAYIKSAKLQTPVIMDADKPTAHKGYWLNGETKVNGQNEDKTETTYNYHLGGLMAGIPHTFALKKTAYADGATADYSVVARDGRAVPADMYTMKWETLTDANWKTTTTTGDTYTAETTKVGDRYHILLTGAKNSPFEGSEAVSKDIAIGELQGVVVTVEAIDAITKTDETDVYQLNDIELTAKVEAADDENADRKPTGYVGFYYYDDKAETGNDPYVWLGKAKLEEIDGEMIATITTNELPVTPTTNIKRDVKITAVYFGDQTFKASENWDEANKKVTYAEVKDVANKYLVKSDTVTVYSSVVYNCKDENKKQEACSEKGIHISVDDGVFKANEKNVVLKLSDIYTLDRELGENLLDIIAKLTPGMDYTIQWQKLNNANAFSDKDGADFTKSKHWQDIADATGVTVVLGTVEQNTAYRAVITVKDQPITKGSYTKVKQAVEGRQVYYSNILMPTDASITMSVMVNTDKNGKNLEGITERETVTANVFLSGVTGSVPNAEIEVMVEADAAKGNNNKYAKSFTKATVNGWNSIDWDTKDVEPGFYTMKITAKTNTGYATKIFERSIIVRESSYNFNIGNQTTTYNGQTQGVTVTLNGFHFNGNDIDDAAAKSWTVKYYKGEVRPENLVEPSQAGTYKAVVTLPGSAYWTEHSETVDFTISKRSVSIADAVAQAKVYDGTDNVNIVEVILNDATTAQDSTGLPTNNIGIINGDSIYAVATEKKLRKADAGNNSFTIDSIQLLGDDAANYVWNDAVYTEPIYVSRSQVYGETAALISGTDVSLKLKKGDTFPADQVIKMIDQAGNKLEANKGYTLTFYYHSDTEIKQTNDLSKLGLYTVVARPKQDNYKGGVTMKFEVIDGETTYTPAAEPKPSTLITISNTAELYGNTGNTGVQTSFTNDATLSKIEYQNGANWTKIRPTDAGRYLLKVTASTGDVAYGIYTITKAHPSISITAAEATYNSMPYTGAATEVADYYLTYAGDVAIGFDVQKDGNVAEQAPVDAGDYVVTLHVNETQNYTAHEVSAPFTIAKKALTIKADSRKTTQYDAFPTMTATYDGLAAETNDGTPDTSLRDVQIAPEFIYNPTNDKPNYSNAALDQVGRVAVQPIDALAKNYKLSYGDGEYVKSETESNPDLEILGLPQSGEKDGTGNKYVAKVYYGDKVQLYPYGNYAAWANYSSEFKWEITGENRTNSHGYFEITDDGVLKVEAIGSFTVKLTRGEGEQEISTTVEVTALRKEAKIALKEVDKVYNGEDQTYAFENITVHDDLYREITPFGEGKLNRTKLSRKNIGTQIPTATVNTSTTGSWYYQSETYGGQFTINDKEATVAPGAQSTVYGTTEKYEDEKWTVTGEANGVKAVDNVNVASQTDVYDRLDVHDGYEILVAGTEDINYNVKYITDQTAEDSAVTTYGGMKLYSTTTKAKAETPSELNDATVYGEQANALDWILDAVKSTTRGTTPETTEYVDNLADFDLTDTFVSQDKDDCVGNKVTYKAANRVEGNTSATALDPTGGRTAEHTAKDDNYELKFGDVTNAKAANYTLANADVKNDESAMTAPTGTVGFIDAATTTDNLIEGSANIAQRPVTLSVDSALTGKPQFYWGLSQDVLYNAFCNILKAEENKTNSGLAKGHTIEDLDLQFTIITSDNNHYTVTKDAKTALNFAVAGDARVTVTVGDTNYVLANDGGFSFEIVLKTIRIEATFYNMGLNGFDVRIRKLDAADNPAGALTAEEAKNLTFKIFTENKTTGYVGTTDLTGGSGKLTFVRTEGGYGIFHGSNYSLSWGMLSSGENFYIQLYENGVPLTRK